MWYSRLALIDACVVRLQLLLSSTRNSPAALPADVPHMMPQDAGPWHGSHEHWLFELFFLVNSYSLGGSTQIPQVGTGF